MRMLRRSTLILWASVVLIAAACAVGPGPAPTSAPASLPPAAPASSVPAPSAAPVPSSATAAAACPTSPQTVSVPSDRLVNMGTSRTATHDIITFMFASSTPGPGGPPSGTLDGARPPFSYAGSGLPIDLLGERAVQVRFTGMTIASEAGEPVYQGLARLMTNKGAFRDAILYDASEGVIGWYLGYDGSGCVTIDRTGNAVTVTITHG